MTTKLSQRRRWKHDELEIAKLLDGERVPVSGRQRGYAPDIRVPDDWLAIEVKSRREQLKVIQEMMAQAEAAAKRLPGSPLPIGIYHVVGSRYRNALVFLRYGDFLDWFGKSAESEPPSDLVDFLFDP